MNDIEFLLCNKPNWYKVDKKFILDHSTNVDWNYSQDNLTVDLMWEELYSKLLSVSDYVPSSTLKTTRDGQILQRLPWDCSKLIRKRKDKDRSWLDFEKSPSLDTFNTAMYQQKQYETSEIQAKVKHERKLVKNLKGNSKLLFKYLKSKSKITKAVSTVKCADGTSTVTPADTAEALADLFESVFTKESFGPLKEECYKKYTDLG